MLVLYETALGFCLFKVSDSAKLENADLWKEFESPEKANKLYVCFELHRMEDVDFVIYDLNKPQTKSVTSVHIHCDCRRRHHCPSRRKARKGVKAILDGWGYQQGEGKGVARSCRPESWWVCPRGLFFIWIPFRFYTGRSISKKLNINVSVQSEGSIELWRGIRSQLAALMDGLDPKDLATMSLGLSHSLSRLVARTSLVDWIHWHDSGLNLNSPLTKSTRWLSKQLLYLMISTKKLISTPCASRFVRVFLSRINLHAQILRNGMAGTSLKWPKSSPTILLMLKSSDTWVCKSFLLS